VKPDKRDIHAGAIPSETAGPTDGEAQRPTRTGAGSVARVAEARPADGRPNRQPPRISYVIGRLDRALTLALGTTIAAERLTLGEYTVLSLLSRTTGLSNAQLARRSLVRPQSMMQVIAALERRGLIEREPDANHRRILRARVTPEGKGVLAACDDAVTELENEMLGDLAGPERDLMLAMLVSCVRRLGAGLDDA
jgi:DNA-binding MarR family transcriptional regulator